VIVTSDGGGSRVGALKLYFGKTFPLDEVSGAYVATVVHQFAATRLQSFGTAELKHCAVIDVFSKRVDFAPRAFTRRRKDIEAACEEIAIRWPVT
jgi:hypothetical protein